MECNRHILTTIHHLPLFFLISCKSNFQKESKNLLFLNHVIHNLQPIPIILGNLVELMKKVKDVFKEMCTPRNPEPPCGRGMIEKKRPNGATCCYKSK